MGNSRRGARGMLRSLVCAAVLCAATSAWAQEVCLSPWAWPEKTTLGPFTVYGGQRFSLIVDENRDSTYLKNYDLALFVDCALKDGAMVRSYFVVNPEYRKHPQVQSSLWPIYLYWQKDMGSGTFQVGKVPMPFNYRNGFPEYHSQVRRVTRIWDLGLRYTSKPRNGFTYDLSIVNDGTSPAADSEGFSDKPAVVAQLIQRIGRGAEVGLSGLMAHGREVTGIGEVDFDRLGAHFALPVGRRTVLRGEYVDFTSLTQCSSLSPVHANKDGSGFVLEGIHQLNPRASVFANYNELERDETTPSTVRTLTIGGRYKFSDNLYLIPELWFVDDELPLGDTRRDDDRYILTALILF